MITDKNVLAYFGGYVDGDGCFNLRKQWCKTYFKYSGQLIITSTNICVLNFFQEHFGGTVTSCNNRARRPNEKNCFRYVLFGKHSANIAETIFPFLKERTEQCQCYIDFVRESCKTRKDILIEQMINLKKFCGLVKEKDVSFLKSIKRSKKLKSLDYPYISGFIDAECCISVYRYRVKNRKNFLYKLVLSFNNTRLPCFIYLIERFGGSVSFIRAKGNCNNQISLRISGNDLHDLLPNIHHFLITKKPVCEELMKFKKLILKNGGARHTDKFKSSYQANLVKRDNIFNKVHKLNLKGFYSV